MQSIDACHSRHHIYKGPTYHFLVGRNGNNRNVTIAMTLTRSETSDSYQWMANNLMTMRGGDGCVINAGRRALGSLDSEFTFTLENPLSPYATLVNKSTSGNPGRRASDESRTCIISDGFKGTPHFAEMVSLIDVPNTPKEKQYQNPQACLCVRHLIGSARENEKTQKRPGSFQEGLVYAIAKACTENEQKKSSSDTWSSESRSG